MVERPESVWANCVNLVGLYSSFPVKCHTKGKVWVDDDSLEVERLGLVVRGNEIIFAALIKDEVQTWTLGVLSAFKIIQKWSSVR